MSSTLIKDNSSSANDLFVVTGGTEPWTVFDMQFNEPNLRDSSLSSNHMELFQPKLNITSLAATNVGELGFTANWEEDSGDYILQVAFDNLFVNFLEGYEELNVIDVNNYSVSAPEASVVFYRVKNSADIEWSEPIQVQLADYIFLHYFTEEEGIDIVDHSVTPDNHGIIGTQALSDSYIWYQPFTEEEGLVIEDASTQNNDGLITDVPTPPDASILWEHNFTEEDGDIIGDSSPAGYNNDGVISTISSNILYGSDKVTRPYIYVTDFNKLSERKLTNNDLYQDNKEGRLSVREDKLFACHTVDVYGTSRAQVFLINIQTGDMTQLTAQSNRRYISCAFRPGDPDHVYAGKYMVSPNTNYLVKINIHTLVEEIIFDNGGYGLYDMVFTKDGNDAVFVTGGGGFSWVVKRRDMITGVLTTLGNTGNNNSAGTPEPSNDKSVIYYKQLIGSYYQIFSINWDNTNKTQRTTGNTNKARPVLSPDNTQILFQESVGSDTNIMLADTTYDISGYFENKTVWLDTEGNYNEVPFVWLLT